MTPEMFRNGSGIFWSTGRLPEPPPPEGLMGLMGLSGKGEEGCRVAAPSPLGWSELDEGGVAPPLFPSPFPPLSLSPSLGKGRGLQLGLGILVELPYRRAPPWPASSSLPPLYTWEGGTPKTQKSFS
jgi:hypothetical protein